MPMKPILLAACLLTLPFVAAEEAAIVSIQLPADSLAYKPGKGVEMAQALCVTCHSAEYVSTQPPMPRKFWEGSVKKMKEKFGATLPDDTTALVDYLTAVYGEPEAQ